MSRVPIFNNRIPATDLDKVPAKAIFNERADLAQKITVLQDKLNISRCNRIREDEMVKCTLKFLVKFHTLLNEIAEAKDV